MKLHSAEVIIQQTKYFDIAVNKFVVADPAGT